MEQKIILTDEQKLIIKKMMRIAGYKYLHEKKLITDEQLNTLINEENN
jgi:hypothetical protein